LGDNEFACDSFSPVIVHWVSTAPLLAREETRAPVFSGCHRPAPRLCWRSLILMTLIRCRFVLDLGDDCRLAGDPAGGKNAPWLWPGSGWVSILSKYTELLQLALGGVLILWKPARAHCANPTLSRLLVNLLCTAPVIFGTSNITG